MARPAAGGYRSGVNKRRSFPHIGMQAMLIETPGVALVRVVGDEETAG